MVVIENTKDRVARKIQLISKGRLKLPAYSELPRPKKYLFDIRIVHTMVS